MHWTVATATNTGVLWDLHHPWRMGEEMQTTWDRIGQWVRYIHVKDACTRKAQQVELCLVGEGVVPLPEADVALPAYVKTMNSILAR